jgi:hypothetical protein
MLKEDASSSSLPLDASELAPNPHHERGDACQYCRNRRIRCSGTQPMCHQCTNLGRECLYDTGKPINRVEQLDDKVSEIEALLRSGGPSTPTQSNTEISAADGCAQARAAGPPTRGTSEPQPLRLPHHCSIDASATQPASTVRLNPAYRAQLPHLTSIPPSAT